MQILVAPVQGHTDAAYRHFHSNIYKGDSIYFTPFIRLERGEIRNRDLKDLFNDLNENHKIIPQIIFRNKEELDALIKILVQRGVKEIDLNMGCPFPLQTGHGRGAATIADPVIGNAVEMAVKENPDVDFSVKMRLGLSDPYEWKQIMPVFNRLELKRITLHPRIARQQYSGELDMDAFSHFLSESKNPVVYNGELKTPEDIERIKYLFPGISGVMLGRGLLGRPSLISEYLDDKEWPIEERIHEMLAFHNSLFHHYSGILCGDTQVISKIKPFWEYSETEIGRKIWKSIKKAGNLAKYQTAVAML